VLPAVVVSLLALGVLIQLHADEFKEVFFERNMPPANYLSHIRRRSEAEWKQWFAGLDAIAAKSQP
jgi:hypothetical protein